MPTYAEIVRDLTVSYTHLPESHFRGMSLQGIIIPETFLRMSEPEKC